ncbi:fumarylacetoacetate hydrolase family protein [Halioxenophilus aromaticivorans]|uniref:Fumarylacetoacetate hydrolase family protein n=1 Tax=Halioxenophilus aromaticivorans TaxID=1306992 RepID=A0AAV3TZP9_9ALTE
MQTPFPPSKRPTLTIADSDLRFPVRRIYCVGRNYADHAREMGANPDREPPFFFAKPSDAIVESGQDVRYPPQTTDLHHEVELVMALQSGGSNIAQEKAMDCVYGFAVGIDLTRRDLQTEAKKMGRAWCTSKGFDDSAVVGNITPAATCTGIETANIALSVNGDQRQQGNVNQMIWSCAEVISCLSELFELQPGDLIFTGTPAGVSALQRGDTLDATIEGLTPLRNTII